MSPTLFIAVTAVLVVIRVVRLMPLLRARSPAATAPGPHPVILLVGTLLSLLALFSILRYVPPAAAESWALFFHVGFICLWLLLVMAPGASVPHDSSRRRSDSPPS
jgi:uncharacterized membrane protein